MAVNWIDAQLQVGSGWHPLIYEVYGRLPTGTVVTQVKEKFGQLRIYVDSAPVEFLEFLDDIENRSGKVCENCGAPGKARTGSWIKTLCDQHAKQR